MLPIFSRAWVIKKCEYLPSAEYPAVIMTTPAMNLPRPSVTPEAVRNSVSMFSLTTGARAGISLRNSGSVAARQRRPCPGTVPAEVARTNDEAKRMFRTKDDITESPIKLDYAEESASKAGLLSIIDLNAGQCDLSVPGPGY